MSSVAVGAPLHPATEDKFTSYAFVCAFFSSLALLVSIAVAHLCLAAALLLLLLSKTRVRLPPIIWPLAGFLTLTVASLLLSGDPASGWPQVKKFFVFSTLPVVYSLFPRLDQARRLIEAWFVCALVAALLSMGQFVYKIASARAAGVDFYSSYIPDRITGFFSHWMTFSQVGLLVFLVLLSYLLFSTSGVKYGRYVWFGCGLVLGFALALSFTRSVWLALPVAAAYLVWHWNRKLLWLGPVALAIVVLTAPGDARRRLGSIVQPDENSARLIMLRTGARMIDAHPWFGLGPERVGPRFREFMPAGIEKLPDAYYGHLHNMYVHYAAERGLPALVMLLWLLGKVLWDHGRALQKLPPGRSDQRFFLHAVIAATLAVGVVGCFDLTLGDSEILGVYLTLIAVGYRVVERVSGAAPATASSV